MVVTVYTKPGCVQCNATYKTMDKKGINFTPVDVTQDSSAFEKASSFGVTSMPIVVVEKEGEVVNYWGGFNPDKIEQTAIDIKALASEAA